MGTEVKGGHEERRRPCLGFVNLVPVIIRVTPFMVQYQQSDNSSTSCD